LRGRRPRPAIDATADISRSSPVLLPKLDSLKPPLRRKLRQISQSRPDGFVQMPGSVISLFSELDEFQAALRADGLLNLLVTGSGQFRARLTQVTLHRLRLSAGDEYLSRIAFVAVPADMLLVTLPLGDRPAPIWDGVEMQVGEMITLGPGQRLHARSDGPCQWAAIRLPVADFVQYGSALRGVTPMVPALARWRPPRAALRQLRHLCQAAVRIAEARSGVLADREAAHGLEQQMIHALVESLSAGPVYEETEAARRYRGIVARFEELLDDGPPPSVTAISAALSVSQRMLRECCKKNLGMDPSRYRRLRGMQRARRALRGENPDIASVSAVARRCGFRDPGRFAVNYRALYGELPSATLRRRPGSARLVLGDCT
jgi:AraC-like DNA-binding protein